jgi:hypothetical protein
MKTTKQHSSEAAPKAASQLAAAAQPTLARQIGNAGLLRILQAKLTVSDPHDPFEQEADRIADQVMRMADADASSALAAASPQTTTVQRAADATSALPVVDAATKEPSLLWTDTEVRCLQTSDRSWSRVSAPI